ncbi:hypothetical protein H5410_031567, partial [Solanum commersonii]
GTLISLVNQKKLLLTRRRNDITSLIRSIEKGQRLTDVIEEQHLLEPRNPEVGVHIRDYSTKHVPQNPEVEEQVQLNSTTIEMLTVHGRHDRKLVVLNKGGQPVGSSNDVVIELSSFLNTLARNATLCHLCPNFQEKYDISKIENRWTLKTIQEAWRRHKFYLKTHYFDAYGNDQS